MAKKDASKAVPTAKKTSARSQKSPSISASRKSWLKLPRFSTRSPLKLVIIGGFVVVVAGLIFGGWRYAEQQKQLRDLKAQQTVANPDDEVLGAVAKLAVLPGGEKPTIGVINDIDKLKSQRFYTAAQNGDKVLLFTKAKTAVIYRSSTNQIVNMSNNITLQTSSDSNPKISN